MSMVVSRRFSPSSSGGPTMSDGKHLAVLAASEDSLSNNPTGGISNLALEFLFSNLCLLEGALSTHVGY